MFNQSLQWIFQVTGRDTHGHSPLDFNIKIRSFIMLFFAIYSHFLVIVIELYLKETSLTRISVKLR